MADAKDKIKAAVAAVSLHQQGSTTNVKPIATLVRQIDLNTYYF